MKTIVPIFVFPAKVTSVASIGERHCAGGSFGTGFKSMIIKALQSRERTGVNHDSLIRPSSRLCCITLIPAPIKHVFRYPIRIKPSRASPDAAIVGGDGEPALFSFRCGKIILPVQLLPVAACSGEPKRNGLLCIREIQSNETHCTSVSQWKSSIPRDR